MVSLSRLLWGRWAADGLCCSVPGHVPAAGMPLPATHNGCGRIGRAPPHPQSESDRQSGSVALAACSAAESGQQSVDPRARRRAIGSARDARGASGGRERASPPPPPPSVGSSRLRRAAAQAPPCSQPPRCAPCSCCPGRRCTASDRASCCFAQAPLIGRSDQALAVAPPRPRAHAPASAGCASGCWRATAARGGRMCGSTSRRRCGWASS